MSCDDDKTQTFRMLEQPCALRTDEKVTDLRRPGRAYDFALSDSDYDAARRDAARRDVARRDATEDPVPPGPQPQRRNGRQMANR